MFNLPRCCYSVDLTVPTLSCLCHFFTSSASGRRSNHSSPSPTLLRACHCDKTVSCRPSHLLFPPSFSPTRCLLLISPFSILTIGGGVEMEEEEEEETTSAGNVHLSHHNDTTCLFCTHLRIQNKKKIILDAGYHLLTLSPIPLPPPQKKILNKS